VAGADGFNLTGPNVRAGCVAAVFGVPRQAGLAKEKWVVLRFNASRAKAGSASREAS